MTNYIELIDEKLNLYNQLIEKRKNYLSNLKFKKQLIKNAEKNIGDTVDKKIREKYGVYKEENYNGYILNIRKNLEIFERNKIEKALKKLQEEDYTKVYDKLIIDIASKSKAELLNLKKELEDYGKKLADEINEVNVILMTMNIDSDGKILNRNERIAASKRSHEIRKEQKYLITCLNKLAKALSLVSLENYQEINLNQKEQEKYDEILNKITKKDKVVNEDVSTIEDESKEIEDSNSKLSVQAFELLTTIARNISGNNIEEANSNLEKVKQILENITDEKEKENLLFWVNKYTNHTRLNNIVPSSTMSMGTMMSENKSPIVLDASANIENDYARKNDFETDETKYQNPGEIFSKNEKSKEPIIGDISKANEQTNDNFNDPEIAQMVNKANEILSLGNYDAAKAYIDTIPEFNGKKNLENKVAALLGKVEELVKKAEIDQSYDSYNNAMKRVSSLVPSEKKAEFLNRLNKVSEIVSLKNQVMSSTKRVSETLNESNYENAPEVVVSNDVSEVYKSGGNLAASIYDSIQQEINEKDFRITDSNNVSYVDYKKLFSALEKYYEQHKATDYVFINSEGKKERCKIKFANIKRLKKLSAKSTTYVYDSNLKELKPVKGGNYIDEKELVLNFGKLFQVKKNSWLENLLNEKVAEIEDENNTKGKKIVK